MALISTVNALQTEIARRLNEVTVSSTEADRYLDYINLGMEDIAGRFPQAPWLQTSAVLTLAAASRTYQVSSIASNTVSKIYDITISAQEKRLQYIPKEQFDALDPKPDDTGVPTVYTVYNDELEFYPTPNTADGAQIRFAKTIATVSAASATLEIPRKYIETVVLYGWIQGLYVREDYDQAQIIEAKYNAAVERMKRDLKRVALESRRMLSVRELQIANQVYGDEITQQYYG